MRTVHRCCLLMLVHSKAVWSLAQSWLVLFAPQMQKKFAKIKKDMCGVMHAADLNSLVGTVVVKGTAKICDFTPLEGIWVSSRPYSQKTLRKPCILRALKSSSWTPPHAFKAVGSIVCIYLYPSGTTKQHSVDAWFCNLTHQTRSINPKIWVRVWTNTDEAASARHIGNDILDQIEISDFLGWHTRLSPTVTSWRLTWSEVVHEIHLKHGARIYKGEETAHCGKHEGVTR